jgi:hypothetical protein
MAGVCTHLDAIQVTSPQLVHLHPCLGWGQGGCRDSAPSRRANAHAGSFGHPMVRPLEPSEDWCRRYEREVMFRADLAEGA